MQKYGKKAKRTELREEQNLSPAAVDKRSLYSLSLSLSLFLSPSLSLSVSFPLGSS
ncbi:uncharacterized protein Dmoj_GI26205 [Drosophila mojavensis]|uniref:Uncharacterized protein n=1 Tax=Drosophila mojavensis TaxID=7230 RepID=A0A0Q9XB10_DROMO|nr:uncharacterized protein Dmoj_GI26205 [Drosophila mojavensis]